MWVILQNGIRLKPHIEEYQDQEKLGKKTAKKVV